MKRYYPLLAAFSVAVAAGAANGAADSPMPAGQEVGVTARHFLYDGEHEQVIYYDNVVATNAQGTLSCERLTINLPPEGSLDRQPTNAVAETNVVVILVKKGDTNHITCDRAIYTYQVLQGTTNDTITFLGSTNHPARVENSKGWMTGEPLVWDNVNGNFSGVDTETHFKVPATTGEGSNSPATGMPLNLLR